MGRASAGNEAELMAERAGAVIDVAVVPDPLAGHLLIAAGANPIVSRVLGTREGGVTQFQMERIDGEWFGAGELWPDLVPSRLRANGQVHLVPAALLRPVDLLWVWCGSSYRHTARATYCLWQPANRREALVPLSERQMRAALASTWVATWRRTDAPLARGIRLTT